MLPRLTNTSGDSDTGRPLTSITLRSSNSCPITPRARGILSPGPAVMWMSPSSNRGRGAPRIAAAVECEKRSPGRNSVVAALTRSSWSASARTPQNGRLRSRPSSRRLPTPAATASATRNGERPNGSGNAIRGSTPAHCLISPTSDSSCPHPSLHARAETPHFPLRAASEGGNGESRWDSWSTGGQAWGS